LLLTIVQQLYDLASVLTGRTVLIIGPVAISIKLKESADSKYLLICSAYQYQNKLSQLILSHPYFVGMPTNRFRT